MLICEKCLEQCLVHNIIGIIVYSCLLYTTIEPILISPKAMVYEILPPLWFSGSFCRDSVV